MFEHPLGYILRHEDELPWLKIFSAYPYKELSDCDLKTKKFLLECMDICEKTLIEYYNPEKINCAIFGNYLPHLHIHVMARFKEDAFFPESTWGIKQRESNLVLPPFKGFEALLNIRLAPLLDFS
ncbi:MAG: HIT family protein [Campylobacteraceae bacterium]|nr:HIT family protein [Campylobacteraceae bacterium]